MRQAFVLPHFLYYPIVLSFCKEVYPLEINSLHVEYDWFRIRRDDCIDVSTENDSFYCYFHNAKNIVTKLAFATEAIYQMQLNKKRSTKKEENNG